MVIAGYILFFIIFVYLFLGVLYLLILAVAGLMSKKKQYSPVENKRRIAVIIPAYKEDKVIVETAMKAAAHDYPSHRFSVFVVADKLQDTTISKLRSIPVNVVPVAFASSTKSKSLQASLEVIGKDAFGIVMILDADNIMKNGCLEQVNSAFESGYHAVQCHRTAKNKHTAVAFLDAVSEEINNHLFRKGPRALKCSAALIGSGMAFRFDDLKKIFDLPHILDNPGEDREIDMQLMKDNIIVEYADHAIVYDEKVASAQVFERQRVRWLEAQVNHFRRFFHSDMQPAPRNLNYYMKFFQTLLLPRSLYILALGIIALLLLTAYLLRSPFIMPSATWWIGMMILFAITLLISIPASFYNYQMLRAVIHLPVLIFSMLKALLRIRRKRTEFLHTPKTFTS